jgi:hypothetical protein
MTNDTNPAQELEAMRAGLEALLPLDERGRARAVSWIASALGVASSAAAPSKGRSGGGPAAPGELGTPKQFLAEKAPQTDIERVTVLAYYLTHALDSPHFETNQLSALNLEAACPKFANVSYSASNALKKAGYLAAGSGKTRQITARGEALVNALPDREAAKAAVEGMAGKPRRARAGKPKSKPPASRKEITS